MAEAPRAEALREAAEWFAVLEDQPSEAQRSSWRQWLAADPGHAQAWSRVEALSRRFQDLPPQLDKHATVQAWSALSQRGSRRQGLKVLAGLGLGGTGAWLTLREQPWQHWMADASTGVGQRRELVLPDGSRAWLNTDTAVQLAFDSRLRQLTLLRGEVLVETAHDSPISARPFQVALAEGWVRPLGTRFSVWRDDTGPRVAVFQGQVEVQPRDGSATARLGAGRQLQFSARQVGQDQPAEALRESWSRGLLQADNLRLDAFVAELSRHHRGLVTCSPQAGALRLVGSFPLADTGQIYQALASQLPVRVSQPLPWWTRIELA